MWYIESNICVSVLLNLLNSLWKRNKMQAWHFISFPQLVLINSIKHEHLCKILYSYTFLVFLRKKETEKDKKRQQRKKIAQLYTSRKSYH